MHGRHFSFLTAAFLLISAQERPAYSKAKEARDNCEIATGADKGAYPNQTLIACASICNDQTLLAHDKRYSSFGKTVQCSWQGRNVIPKAPPAWYPVPLVRPCEVAKQVTWERVVIGSGATDRKACEKLCRETAKQNLTDEWMCSWNDKEFKHLNRPKKTAAATPCTDPKLDANIIPNLGMKMGQKGGLMLHTDQKVTWTVAELPPWARIEGYTLWFEAPAEPGVYRMTAVGVNSCKKSLTVPVTLQIENQ